MSYETAELSRQTILDHLHAHGEKGAMHLFRDIGTLTRNSVEASVRMMTRLQEIEKIGAGQATRYKALVTTTKSAEEIREEVEMAKSEKAFKAKRKQSPGRYVHIPDEPIKNQEGQGSGRSRVYVGATAGML